LPQEKFFVVAGAGVVVAGVGVLLVVVVGVEVLLVVVVGWSSLVSRFSKCSLSLGPKT
jgi:hypothetical protein